MQNEFSTLQMKTEAIDSGLLGLPEKTSDSGSQPTGANNGAPTAVISGDVTSTKHKRVPNSLKFKKTQKKNADAEVDTTLADETTGAPKEAKKRNKSRTRDPPAKRVKLDVEPATIANAVGRQGDILETGQDIRLSQGNGEDQVQADLLASLLRMSVAVEGPEGAPEADKSSKSKQKKSRKSTKKRKTDDVAADDENVVDAKPPKPARTKRVTTGVAKQKKSAPLTLGEPCWTLAKTQTSADTKNSPSTGNDELIRPKIWCGSKEELLAAQPELSKLTNNITWLMSQTPVIFLDNLADVIISDLAIDKLSFDLKLTRDFSCLLADLALPVDQEAAGSSLRLRGGAASPPYESTMQQHPSNSAHSFDNQMGYRSRDSSSGRQKRHFPNLHSASRHSQSQGPSSQNDRKHYRFDFDSGRPCKNGPYYSRSPGPLSHHNPDHRHPSSSSYYSDKHAARGPHPRPPPPPWDSRNHFRDNPNPGYTEQYTERKPYQASSSSHYRQDYSPTSDPSHPDRRVSSPYARNPDFLPHARHYRTDEPPCKTDIPQGPRPAGFWKNPSRSPRGSVRHRELGPSDEARMLPGYHSMSGRRGPSDYSSDAFNTQLPPLDRNFRAPTRSDRSIQRSSVSFNSSSFNQYASPMPHEPEAPQGPPASGPLGVWKNMISQDYGYPGLPSSHYNSGGLDYNLTKVPSQGDNGMKHADPRCLVPSYYGNVDTSFVKVQSRSDYEMGELLPNPSSLDGLITLEDHEFREFGSALTNAPPQIDDKPETITSSLPPYLDPLRAYNWTVSLSEPPSSDDIIPSQDCNAEETFMPESAVELKPDQFVPPKFPTEMDPYHVNVNTSFVKAQSRGDYVTRDVIPITSSLPSYLNPLHAYNRTASLSEPPSSDDIIPAQDCNAEDTFMPESAVELDPDQVVPPKIPTEIEAVCSSYVSGIPVVFIASRSLLAQRWGLFLPEECGVAYLGFFKITSLQEQRVASSQSPPAISDPDVVHGGVEWRFTFNWMPDSEDAVQSEASNCYPRPWWAPSTPSAPPDHEIHFQPPAEDFTRTSPHYCIRRMQSPNYALREIPLYKLYSRLLPHFLYAAPADGSKNSVVPPGWFCSRCGRVNVQDYMRHRVCLSSLCMKGKGKQNMTEAGGQGEGYFVPLELLRDPQQASPLSHPVNVYPIDFVEGIGEDWDDGMQTYIYPWKGRSRPQKKLQDMDEIEASLTHVFTGNSEWLQGDATDLLREFQLHVPLKRKMGSTSPYFLYTAGTNRSGLAVPWKDVPECVTQARDLIISRISNYAEKEIAISRLSIYAWVTTGTRKASDTLTATKTPVVLMALGSEVSITFVPKSGFQEPAVVEAPAGNLLPMTDWEGDIPMGDQVPMHDTGFPLSNDQDQAVWQNAAGPSDAPEDILHDFDGPDETAEGLFEDDAPEKETPKKGNKQSLMITLVHGDVMMLSGDNFEYSIKRLGTSILLIGSTVD